VVKRPLIAQTGGIPARVPSVLAAASFAALLAVGFPSVAVGAGPHAAVPSCSTNPAMISCAVASADDTVPPATLMPNSLFNHNVTSWPVDPNSASLVGEFNSDWQTNFGNVGVNGRPVIWVPASQPLVPLTAQAGCNTNFLLNTGRWAPIPSWAPTSGPADDVLTIYQPSSNTVWELWQAHQVTTGSSGGTVPGSTGWSACWAGKAFMSTFSGVFPSPYGETATGISNLATEVTEADIQSGSINHAIGIQIVNCSSDVFPADRSDCAIQAGDPAEGQWFRFAASVNCANYNTTPFENEVCLAGQQRGFVVVDHGGSDAIEADYATGSWTDEGNPGPLGSWQNNPLGGCCIFAGGGGPLEDAFETTSGTYEQEWQVIAALPWSQLQVVDPPHFLGRGFYR
jgi:hypothetical protein